MTAKITIHFEDENKYGLTKRTLQKRLRDILAQLFPLHELKEIQLTVDFVDAQTMQSLNAQYRKKDYATNILSFPETLPLPGKKRYLGSLVLCASVIREEAIQQHKTFENHLTHLLVHGCLHLLGYDHERPREARVMEAREITFLAIFGIHNPYV